MRSNPLEALSAAYGFTLRGTQTTPCALNARISRPRLPRPALPDRGLVQTDFVRTQMLEMCAAVEGKQIYLKPNYGSFSTLPLAQ